MLCTISQINICTQGKTLERSRLKARFMVISLGQIDSYRLQQDNISRAIRGEIYVKLCLLRI
jgi:hypothetical protein